MNHKALPLSKTFRNSEVNASKYLKHLEEMFSQDFRENFDEMYCVWSLNHA